MDTASHAVVGVAGIRPEGIEGIVVHKGLHGSLHMLQIMQAPAAITQSAVDHQGLVSNQRADGQPVKCAVDGLKNESPALPHPLLAVMQEAELSHVLAHVAELVVPTNQVHLLRVQHMQCEEQGHNFQLMLASIHPVSVEDVRHSLDVPTTVVGLSKETEQEQQIAQLTVDVPEYLRWCSHSNETGIRRALAAASLGQQADLVRLL
mmetsp:Transcript_57765/g.135356  ORF Transcript_57765/g.135356 Transcript_57765/m.135356 type:complete len:206 (-) Transcript_57765:1100-1717(-)